MNPTKKTKKLRAREVDPHGKSAHTPGAKLDAGKVPILRGLMLRAGA